MSERRLNMAKKTKEQKMYIVMNNDGHMLWDDKTERTKVYSTKAAALREARLCARSNPGETVSIYRKAADVRLPVGPDVEVTPFE